MSPAVSHTTPSISAPNVVLLAAYRHASQSTVPVFRRHLASLSGSARAIHRLEQLEALMNPSCSQALHSQALHPEWLDEYLDIGLELAEHAGDKSLWALQESWLKRIYRHLHHCASNLEQPQAWRQLCLDYVYQPFFALQHFYRNRPHCEPRTRQLLNEMTHLSHHRI